MFMTSRSNPGCGRSGSHISWVKCARDMFSAWSRFKDETGHPFGIKRHADEKLIIGEGDNWCRLVPSTFFLGGLSLVTDKGPVSVQLAVEIFHGLVPF